MIYAGPHYFDADPDPVCHFDADLDPARHFDADQHPTFHFDAGTDPDLCFASKGRLIFYIFWLVICKLMRIRIQLITFTRIRIHNTGCA